jgi:RNA cap guanine-N2 methyltransferase
MMPPQSSENRSGNDETSPAADARVEVLRRLHATPEIFTRISDWQGTELALQQRLRSEFADELVREAISLSELRLRAKTKFSQAARMWFDRVGLEQSTSEAVARHKARRFQGTVWDYCCGIGGDAVVLGERCEVIAVDRSPASCLYTEYNAEVYGVSARVTSRCADVESLVESGDLVHIDPDRRPRDASGARSSRRSLRIEEGSPGLEYLTHLFQRFRGGAVKASPAANFGGKFPDAEIELVSL